MSQLLFFLYPFLLGFSSAAAQILAMRALVSALYGNEMIFILVLVGWLTGIAAGSATFRMIKIPADRHGRVVGALCIVSGVLIPLTLLASRYARNILDISPGMLMDIELAALVALAVVFPLSFVLGGLFPALVAWGRHQSVEGGAGRIYSIEAVGFVVGGISMTFLGLPFLSALHIAFLFMVAHIIAGTFLFNNVVKTVLAFLALLIAAILLASGTVQKIDAASQAAQWPGFHLIESRDTVYGNLQLVEKDGTKSLFENGIHVSTTGDAQSSEESVHYALVAHAAPRRLLMIGGGLAGSIAEALKHPGLSIDYIELDEAAIGMMRRHVPEVDRAMADPRVRVIADDGRRFVKRTDRQYDVVIINLSDPLTLLVNRYYTEEFFQEVRRCLADDGILAFSITSSENYLNREGKNYLRMLRRTLGMVFAEVRSIPGERHIFLASQVLGTVAIDPSVLSGRLKERGVETRFVREEYFNFRLTAKRVLEIEAGLLGKAPVNSDTRPSTFLAALVFWSTHFHSGLANTVEMVRRNSLGMLLLPVLAGILALAFRRNRMASAGVIVGVAGFCLMAYQVSVLMAFQSYFGYIYLGVGIITAVFMAGAAVGSFWAGRVEQTRILSQLQSLIIFAAVFAFALGIFLPRLSIWGPGWSVLIGLSVFSLVAGFFGGAQFVLALKYAGEGERNSGLIYALDVIGAAAGAVLGGMFLIPLWGVDLTAFLCGFLQAVVLSALIL